MGGENGISAAIIFFPLSLGVFRRLAIFLAESAYIIPGLFTAIAVKSPGKSVINVNLINTTGFIVYVCIYICNFLGVRASVAAVAGENVN